MGTTRVRAGPGEPVHSGLFESRAWGVPGSLKTLPEAPMYTWFTLPGHLSALGLKYLLGSGTGLIGVCSLAKLKLNFLKSIKSINCQGAEWREGKSQAIPGLFGGKFPRS